LRLLGLHGLLRLLHGRLLLCRLLCLGRSRSSRCRRSGGCRRSARCSTHLTTHTVSQRRRCGCCRCSGCRRPARCRWLSSVSLDDRLVTHRQTRHALLRLHGSLYRRRLCGRCIHWRTPKSSQDAVADRLLRLLRLLALLKLKALLLDPSHLLRLPCPISVLKHLLFGR